MAKTLDRPKVHPEVHPDIHPDIHPDVDEFITKTLEGETITEAPRRPIRWMRWLAAALLLMAAAGVVVVLIMTSGDDTQYAVPSSADAAERWALAEPATAAVPSGSAFDAPALEAVEAPAMETITVELPSGALLEVPMPETMMVELPSGALLEVPMVERVTAVPRSADGSEGWIVSAEPATVVARIPRTADGYELWWTYLDPRVPRSADGYEGWLLSIPLLDRPGVEILRSSDYLPPESTGAVYNYNPSISPYVLRSSDYLPPESTGAVYNYNPERVTEAVPSGSPFDARS